MAIVVTKPVSAPINLSAELVAGGSLAANTTYYYILIAYSESYTTCGAWNRTPFFSDISEEGTFTTDSTNRSVKLYWEDGDGEAGRYFNMILTTTSGVYNETGCGGYGGVLNESIGNIREQDGIDGYTITARSSSTSYFHSCQLNNIMHPRISNNLGLIWVSFTTGNHTLDNVYAAIVAAGYGDYVDMEDNYSFVMKGWIYQPMYDGYTGEFYAENRRIVMLKGGIKNNSSTYEFRFGRYNNELSGGFATTGCIIDLQGARYVFFGYYANSLKVYDSYISFAKSALYKVAEWGYYIYFNYGAGCYISGNIENWSGNIMNATCRGTTSDIKDLKLGSGNNWGNNNFIRLNIWNQSNMPYSAGLGAFYDCDFNTYPANFSVYTFGNYTFNYTNLYDCRYPGFGVLDAPYIRWYIANNDPPTSPNYMKHHYRVQFTVLDEEGLPIENVSVTAIDGLGDSATWIEQDGTKDHLVTGNEYEGEVLTDEDGAIFYYLAAYKNYLNPDNTENINNYSYDSFLDLYYPYTVTFSKDGYRDYTIIIEELTDKFAGVITLEYIEQIIYVDRNISGSIDSQNLSGALESNQINGDMDTINVIGSIETVTLSGSVEVDI